MGSMGESEVVVLGWWPSMFVARVTIALSEKGIKYEYIEEDLPNNKSPLLLNHNPIYKKVPVLIHNGKTICESKIIVQYIDEEWKDQLPLLMPCDPYLKSQASFWADYIDKKVYDSAKKIWASKGEEMHKGGQEVIDSLKNLEGELGEKPYFNGESFGFVDITLISYYSHLYAYGTLGNFSVEKDCPKLFVWATKCMQRESVSKNLADPNRLYELTMAFRKSAGLED